MFNAVASVMDGLYGLAESDFPVSIMEVEMTDFGLGKWVEIYRKKMK